MDTVFWAANIVMLLIATGILITPLLRGKTASSVAYKQSNLDLYQSKVVELETDLAEGRIDQEHYNSALGELDHELLLDVPVENTEAEVLLDEDNSKTRMLPVVVVIVFLPVLAIFLYLELGMGASDEPIMAQQNAGSVQDDSIQQMIQMLANKLDTEGGNAEQWAMLGRSYKQTQRYSESAEAFAQAIVIKPTARLYLEQAEALALLNGKSFVGEPRLLVLKALELAPENINTIWFAGVAEFQSGNYGESLDLLIQLSAEVNTDPEIGKSIRFYVSAARDKLLEQGEDMPTVDELLNTKAYTQIETQTKAPGASLEVAVDISAEIRDLFDKETVVFVYAKAMQGPRMPLAAKRLSLSDLPITIILDDSMAMMAGMNISAFDSVIVSARVSKAGSAIAQPGDYIGSVIVDDVLNSKKLTVLISNIVK